MAAQSTHSQEWDKVFNPSGVGILQFVIYRQWHPLSSFQRITEQAPGNNLLFSSSLKLEKEQILIST